MPSAQPPARANYATSFFDLQLRLASRAAALTGLPVARTLLDYTNFHEFCGV